METINRQAANGGGIHFFGVEQLDEAGLAKLHAVAPIAAVHHGMPPFLVIHGTKDDQVSFEQSTAFCDAIRHVGTACELIPFQAHSVLESSSDFRLILRLENAGLVLPPSNRCLSKDTLPSILATGERFDSGDQSPPQAMDCSDATPQCQRRLMRGQPVSSLLRRQWVPLASLRPWRCGPAEVLLLASCFQGDWS
jgi:acetyl esterase/lipase